MWDKVLEIMMPYRTQTIFVGCSAGVDSMVLSVFLHQHGFKIHLLHVNYQQRGAQSDADMDFVQNFAHQKQIPCDIRLFPQQKKGNFQQEARLFRYHFFEEWVQKTHGMIALAHHADDNVETFFMNLSRKSGIVGLAGIPKVRKKYIRPMLHLWKNEIIDYARQNAIPWREDASNFSTHYYRNRWRLELLPKMEQTTPSIKHSTLTLIEAFGQTQRYLEAKMQKYIHEIDNNGTFLHATFDKCSPQELYELWRQLGQSSAIFERFLELRNYKKGKFIELNVPFERIINEKTYFHFIKTEHRQVKPYLELTLVDRLPNQYSKNELYLAPTKINGTLFVRKWQTGDRIASVGITGTQSVAKIIKDAKIPISERKNIFVVCDNIDIHWIVGLKIGRKALATQNVGKILKVTLQTQGRVPYSLYHVIN